MSSSRVGTREAYSYFVFEFSLGLNFLLGTYRFSEKRNGWKFLFCTSATKQDEVIFVLQCRNLKIKCSKLMDSKIIKLWHCACKFILHHASADRCFDCLYPVQLRDCLLFQFPSTIFSYQKWSAQIYFDQYFRWNITIVYSYYSFLFGQNLQIQLPKPLKFLTGFEECPFDTHSILCEAAVQFLKPRNSLRSRIRIIFETLNSIDESHEKICLRFYRSITMVDYSWLLHISCSEHLEKAFLKVRVITYLFAFLDPNRTCIRNNLESFQSTMRCRVPWCKYE